ncbi:MAG: hypothetical protein AAGG48_25725 [Planctomycetota bacterium]
MKIHKSIRFELHHLLAVATVFAILLSYAEQSGYADRDGLWEVISIDLEDMHEGNFHGEFSPPPLYEYVAHIRDGDRDLHIMLGNNWEIEYTSVPKPGDIVELEMGSLFVSDRKPIVRKVLTLCSICVVSFGVVFVAVLIQNQIVRFMEWIISRSLRRASQRDALRYRKIL